jgi:hypothetical protein
MMWMGETNRIEDLCGERENKRVLISVPQFGCVTFVHNGKISTRRKKQGKSK